MLTFNEKITGALYIFVEPATKRGSQTVPDLCRQSRVQTSKKKFFVIFGMSWPASSLYSKSTVLDCAKT
jgi:hypothetical protein